MPKAGACRLCETSGELDRGLARARAVVGNSDRVKLSTMVGVPSRSNGNCTAGVRHSSGRWAAEQGTCDRAPGSAAHHEQVSAHVLSDRVEPRRDARCRPPSGRGSRAPDSRATEFSSCRVTWARSLISSIRAAAVGRVGRMCPSVTSLPAPMSVRARATASRPRVFSSIPTKMLLNMTCLPSMRRTLRYDPRLRREGRSVATRCNP